MAVVKELVDSPAGLFEKPGIMSDRAKLAREIAARTKPRFIDTNPAPIDRKALARIIAAQSMPRFITIVRERRSHVPFTEEQLTAIAAALQPRSIAGS